MKVNWYERYRRLATAELLALVTRRRMNGQGVNWMTIPGLKRMGRRALRAIERIGRERVIGRSPDQYSREEMELLDEVQTQLM